VLAGGEHVVQDVENVFEERMASSRELCDLVMVHVDFEEHFIVMI